MEWIKEDLYDGYELFGDVEDNAVRLFIIHPNGQKLIRVKHMTQNDIDNSNLDDIRRHFARLISNIQSKTLEQLQLACN